MPKRPSLRLAPLLAAAGLLTAACGADVTTQTAEPDPSPVAEDRTVDSPTNTDVSNPGATDHITVHGHLFDDGTGLVLCTKLLAQGGAYGCEGDGLPISGIDLSHLPTVVHEHGVSYTPEKVTLAGELEDATLVVNQLITG